MSTALACSLSSCVTPGATDSFYQRTAAAQMDAGWVKPNDIVGRWYDAWSWNGHRYTHTYILYSDWTGIYTGTADWREGGEMKNVADMQWAYNGNGGWNVRVFNKQITSGTGRISSEPYTFTVRKMNGRIYNDDSKRTWVNGNDASRVADKNAGVER